MSETIRILVADDERAILDVFEETLVDDSSLIDQQEESASAPNGPPLGFVKNQEGSPKVDLVMCTQGEQAVAQVRDSIVNANPFSVAFIDVRMPPGLSGIKAATEIRKIDHEIEIVLITGFSDVQPEDFDPLVRPVHKTLFMMKPVYPQEIKQFVISLNEKWKTEKELKSIKSNLEQIVDTRNAELITLNKELIEDIAKRKKIESDLLKTTEELKANRMHLAEAQQISQLGSWEWNITDSSIHWSDETFRIFGIEDRESPITMERVKEMIHPDDRDLFTQKTEAALAIDEPYDITFRLSLPQGQIRYVRERAKVHRDENGEPIKMVGSIQDVSVRKRAELEMQKLRNMMSNIISSMPSILIGVNADLAITQLNRAASDYCGCEESEAIGKPLFELIPQFSPISSALSDAMTSKSALTELKTTIQSNGNENLFNVTIYPLETDSTEGTVILLNDVTEKSKMDEMFMETEKMLTVGGLAAGIAHEINNPLAGIVQNMQVLNNRLLGSIKKNKDIAGESGTSIEAIGEYVKKRGLQKIIESVQDAGNRAAKIIENMLNFSYKANSVYTLHKIPDLLEQTIELAKNDYTLKKKFQFKQVEIIREYDEKTPRVPCEGSSIQQVFFNILKNGAHAMGDNDSQTEAPKFYLRVKPVKDMVHIEIEDNGPGMDEDTQSRIFKPFFTTKEIGEGTGLGLSVSHFIIKENHSGTISVETAPGQGAKFIIELPV